MEWSGADCGVSLNRSISQIRCYQHNHNRVPAFLPSHGNVSYKHPASHRVSSRQQKQQGCLKLEHRPKAVPRLTEPASSYEVDSDLWAILDMASDEELERIHGVLYGKSLFSPLFKSLVSDNQPPAILARGRTSVMHRIEERFRFLAADAVATLRGYRPTYREALVYVRDRLAIKCDTCLETADLEFEIYDHVMHPTGSEVHPAINPNPRETESSTNRSHRSRGRSQPRLRSRVPVSLAVGAPELVPTLFKLGSAVTVSRARDAALTTLGYQLRHNTRLYSTALSRLYEAGIGTAQRRAAVQAAQKGLIASTARYSATSGALGILVPLMWAWLGTDLALQALGTDYGRIMPVICLLAQIRLLRTRGFINP